MKLFPNHSGSIASYFKRTSLSRAPRRSKKRSANIFESSRRKRSVVLRRPKRTTTMETPRNLHQWKQAVIIKVRNGIHDDLRVPDQSPSRRVPNHPLLNYTPRVLLQSEPSQNPNLPPKIVKITESHLGQNPLPRRNAPEINIAGITRGPNRPTDHRTNARTAATTSEALPKASEATDVDINPIRIARNANGSHDRWTVPGWRHQSASPGKTVPEEFVQLKWSNKLREASLDHDWIGAAKYTLVVMYG